MKRLRGRFFTNADNEHSARVAVIDETFAAQYFPGEDPIGKHLHFTQESSGGPRTDEIVGVVGHVEHYALDGSQGEKPQIYYPFYQLPDEAIPAFGAQVTLAVRTPLEVAEVPRLAQLAV